MTSDNINVSSAILDWNAESNIVEEMKFVVGDKKYWIWGKARELSISTLENNVGTWRNMITIYKYLNVIRMKE